MENLRFALENIVINIESTVVYIASSLLFWGFCIGFSVATILHLIIITGGVRNAHHVMTKSVDKSYKAIVPSDPNHPEYKSFPQFLLMHRRARRIALLAVTLILAVVVYFVTR